ncbi:MAG: rRNA maturation RNase YbeY [Alphaproteobacteria bacterium]|nr:rRNA maturation RNase YbeY [Alphaproteobacteria bacterium]
MKNKIKIGVIRRFNRWNCVKFAKKPFFIRIAEAFVENSSFLHKAKSLEINLLLTNNLEMQDLNNRFLNDNKPTNVLTFPEKDYNYKSLKTEDFLGDILLGDIAFGLEIIKEEADLYSIPIENHFTHLFIHAILHLVGFDHKNDEDYEVMKNQEIKLLNQLQISRPPIYE